MRVRLGRGVYRLYIVSAGFRMVQGDHVLEDPVSYLHNGNRVEYLPYIYAHDFRSIKDLRVALECDESLSSLITWHRPIWRAAIELLEPSQEEINEAVEAAVGARLTLNF